MHNYANSCKLTIWVPNFINSHAISGLASLVLLNLNRCGICDEGCEKLEGLVKLKVLNLGFNHITDACLIHLRGEY